MKKCNVILCISALIGTSAVQASAPAEQPITIFSHGLGGQGDHAIYYHTQSGQPHAFIEGRMESFDYQDVQDSRASCIGQDADMETLHKACETISQATLVGVSRGAATIFNYLAKYIPKNITAVVAESPFDQVSSVVQHKAGFASFESSLPLVFPNYNRSGPQPIQAAKSIDKDIPVLLVCSDEDALIPTSSTKRLYDALCLAQHTKTHLLVTKHGAHANILNGPDGQLYRNVVHAFFKAYNKSHNPRWAAAGQERFASCKPAVTEEEQSSSWSSFFSSSSK